MVIFNTTNIILSLIDRDTIISIILQATLAITSDEFVLSISSIFARCFPSNSVGVCHSRDLRSCRRRFGSQETA